MTSILTVIRRKCLYALPPKVQQGRMGDSLWESEPRSVDPGVLTSASLRSPLGAMTDICIFATTLRLSAGHGSMALSFISHRTAQGKLE